MFSNLYLISYFTHIRRLLFSIVKTVNHSSDIDSLEETHLRIKRHSGYADPETTTTEGCTCKSQCRASLPLFKHDWCYTGIQHYLNFT